MDSAVTSVDRELWLGVLAVKLGLIEPAELVEGLRAWGDDSSRSHFTQLVEARGVGPEQVARLRAEVAVAMDRRGEMPTQGGNVLLGTSTVKFNFDSVVTPQPNGPRRALADEPARPIGLMGGMSSSGRFEILELHAKGGLGCVFRARDLELNRVVAVKQIQLPLAESSEHRARFWLEAVITGHLEHPGIVPVYSLGYDANGRPFYAMPFIQGHSLKDVIATRWAEADPELQAIAHQKLLRSFLEVCDAIDYAHTKSVLHRDLKPSNIMVGRHGETVVLDWGLAKVSGSPEWSAGGISPSEPNWLGGCETLPGAAVGTPPYMSPEAAAARLEEIGPLSDVYGLGATLYCIITGEPPFPAASSEKDVPALLRRVEAGDFPHPSRVRPDVPRALEAICLKAMAKNPANRYATPRELADDINRYLADEPVRAWREPRWRRARRWVKRREFPVTSAAIVLVMATAFLWAGSLVYVRLRAANRLQRERMVVIEQQHGIEAASRKYNERLGLARGRDPLAFGAAVDAIEHVRAAAAQETPFRDVVELRNEAAACLSDVDLVEHATACEGMIADTLAYHPSGRMLAIAQAKAAGWIFCRVSVVDAATGEPIHELTVESLAIAEAVGPGVGFVQNGVRAVAFSPDGRWLVAGLRDGTLYRWDLNQAPPAAVSWRPHAVEVDTLAFAADGSRAYSRSIDGVVKAWDPTGGSWAELGPALPTAERVMTAAGAGPGRLLLEVGGVVRELDPATRADLGEVATGAGDEAAVTQDGRFLAVSARGCIRIVELATRRVVVKIGDPEGDRAHAGEISSLSFSPDGSLLATTGERENDREFRLWDAATGRLLRTSQLVGTEPLMAAFSPDGDHLAVTAGKKTLIYELAGRSILELGALEADPILATAFSGGSDALAILTRPAGAPEASVAVWADRGRRPLGRWAVPSPGLQAAAPALASDRSDARLVVGGFPTQPARLLGPVGTEASVVLDGMTSPLGFSLDSTRVWGIEDELTVGSWSSADGQRLTAWDNRAAHEITGLGSLYALAVGRERVIIGGRDGSVVQLDASSGQFLGRARPSNLPIRAVALSADGSTIVAGDQGGTLYLAGAGWPAFAAVPAHARAVVGLEFAESGRTLVSASVNGTILVWDLEGGGLVRRVELRHPGKSVAMIRLDGAGQRLAVVSARDRAARVWRLDRVRGKLFELGLGW